MSVRRKMGLPDDVFTNTSRIIILKLEEKGMVGIIVDEVCEVVTLSESQIEPLAPAGKNGKEMFINGIGKKEDTLISLFELGAIVEERDNS
jgi:purine-binding chemotaxis protein CheW